MNQLTPTDGGPNQAAITSLFSLNADDLKNSIKQLINTPDDDDAGKPFITHSGNQWLQIHHNQPEARQLFGELLFENELCILFSDTNVGKSILAVQIADSIARAQGIGPFTAQTARQPVIYFDFELSAAQFGSRYIDEQRAPYSFDEGFIRAALNPQASVPREFGSFEEYICYMIAHEALLHEARVIIIDNITYLRTETERAKDALPLMKQLKTLKERFGLSILALAHTPKRDSSQPITRNDLQGSKMLINFCDSAFAIGESNKDNHLRYLKQIKQRNTEQLYGDSNVLVYQITKPANFLHYEHLGTSSEWEHLKQRTDGDREALEVKVMEMNSRGFSSRHIGAELGISHSSAARIIKQRNSR